MIIFKLFIMSIYALCVGVLICVSKLLGMSYVDTSVYVCEYCVPMIEVLTSGVIIAMCLMSMRKSKLLFLYGLLSLLFLIRGVWVLMERVIAYRDMANKDIFDMVVMNLRSSAVVSGTTYEYENLILYILPFGCLLILLFLTARALDSGKDVRSGS